MKEREDLQQLIFNNSEEFFREECKEKLFVLSQEVTPSEEVKDRIDILALDHEGQLVIVELKRGSNKLQLLQALSYAAMVSDLQWSQIREWVDQSRFPALDSFLENNELDGKGDDGQDQINRAQRIVLIAESYGYEVLCTAKWLTENYGMDVRCYEATLARDASNNLVYLSAVQLYPAKNIAAQARRTGSIRVANVNKKNSIEERLARCSNAPIKRFFEQLLSQYPRRNQKGTAIIIPQMGKMRFYVSLRSDFIRVRQCVRFEGDEKKWAALSLSPKPVTGGANLVFQLWNSSDLEVFRAFLERDYSIVKWGESPADASGDDEEGPEAE